MPSVVGVLREPEYSPGRVEDDAAILHRTRAALATRGVTMTVGTVDLIERTRPAAVLAMCQSAGSLAALDRAAEAVPVINAPDAIRACYRHETVRRLTGAQMPFPPTEIVSTTHPRASIGDLAPCWVKRGDVHAMVRDDVVFAETAAHVDTVLADFAVRGIARAAVQAHVAGVVVKFYGVADGRFFRCYTDAGEIPASLATLWTAAHAGAALGLEVFGGDLVVDGDGRPVLVDVNDWPSFARCREEAADAIAGYVADRLVATAPALHEPQGQHG